MSKWRIVGPATVVIATISSWVVTGVGQDRTSSAAPTSTVRPNLDGIWQAMNTANWDIQDHSAQPGPVQFGALFAVPPGQGVVVGNTIPYQPAAAEKKKENWQKRLTDDPEARCYLPGVPRFVYSPHPFQI